MKILNYILMMLLLFIISACSDINDDVSAPVTTISIHDEGVVDKESEGFHGKLVEEDLESCQQCHAADYSGGTAEQSCVDCHTSLEVHAKGNSHKGYLVENTNKFFECKTCHGTDYAGGTSSPSCQSCHTSLGVHGNDVSHKTYLAENENTFVECKTCHGPDFAGGDISPSCQECHTSLGVHANDVSHNTYIAENEEMFDDCSTCHGDDYAGGEASPSCLNCHSSLGVHATNDFHKTYFLENDGQLENCASCHGSDFSGGAFANSCTTCHSSVGVHQEGVFHNKYFEDNPDKFDACKTCHDSDYSGKDASPGCTGCHIGIRVHADDAKSHVEFLNRDPILLHGCYVCHGADYSGGFASPTCLTCHSLEGGPENCSTCHFDNDIKPAEGTHLKHLDATIAADVNCDNCHVVPEEALAWTHLDDDYPNVELTFSGVAVTQTNSGSIIPSPEFNIVDKSCSNTYCHGYFKNGNLENTVTWSDEISCGSCHGDPETGDPFPGGSHLDAHDCVACHSEVVSNENGTFVISTPAKHINGKLNVFGEERDF